MLVFAPKAKPAVATTSSAPVEASATAAPDPNKPASVDPSEWLKDPSTVSTLQQPAPGSSTRGDVIVIYGERPSVTNTSTSSNGLPAAAATATTADGRVLVDVAPPPATTTVEPQNPPAPAPSTQTVRTEVKQPEPAPKAAPRTTESAPAPKAQKKVEKKVAAAPAPRNDEYWVQTGSFADKGRADAAKSSLGTKGISSLVETKDVSGKTYYRVRIGPYTSKNEADYWLSLVKTIEGFDASYVSLVKAKR